MGDIAPGDARRLDLRPRPGRLQPAEQRPEALPGRGPAMTDTIAFTLDGAAVEALPGETIWQVADRLGVEIPHLCWQPKPGYRADGNCRACMVEIEGERVLAALLHPQAFRRHEGACQVGAGAEGPPGRDGAAGRRPAGQGRGTRPAVAVLALGRRHGRRGQAPAAARGRGAGPEPSGDAGQSRRLHPVQPLRPRLPRGPGQRRHRHGLSRPRARRSCSTSTTRWATRPASPAANAFEACPTGALMPATVLDENEVRTGYAGPHGRQPVPLLRRRLPADLQHQGRQDPVRRGPRRPGEP